MSDEEWFLDGLRHGHSLAETLAYATRDESKPTATPGLVVHETEHFWLLSPEIEDDRSLSSLFRRRRRS